MNRRVVGAAAALIAAVLVMTSTLVARWWHGPMTGATIESKDDAGAPVRMAYNRSVEIRIGTLRAHRCNTKGEQRCDGSAHLDKTPTGFAVAGLATMGAGIMAGLAVAVVALCWLLRASVWRRRLAMVALVLLGLQVIAVVAFWLQVPNDVVFDRVHVDYDVGWGISSMLFVVGVPLAIGLMIFSMRAAELAAVRVPAAAPPLDLARARAVANAPLPAPFMPPEALFQATPTPLPPASTPLPPMPAPGQAPPMPQPIWAQAAPSPAYVAPVYPPSYQTPPSYPQAPPSYPQAPPPAPLPALAHDPWSVPPPSHATLAGHAPAPTVPHPGHVPPSTASAPTMMIMPPPVPPSVPGKTIPPPLPSGPRAGAPSVPPPTVLPLPPLPMPGGAPAIPATVSVPRIAPTAPPPIPTPAVPVPVLAPPVAAAPAAGPAPACPQCEGPLQWVEQHLRFYCPTCRTYF